MSWPPLTDPLLPSEQTFEPARRKVRKGSTVGINSTGLEDINEDAKATSLVDEWKSGIIGYGSATAAYPIVKEPSLRVGQDLVKLIAEIDEFRGRWEALKALSPDRLNALRRVATVESVGSSTRIEGAKLSDAQVETLLSNIQMRSFNTRDEQEVAGYAEGRQIGVVFETANPFDIPREMEKLVA